jgi:transposase InsO family protein
MIIHSKITGTRGFVSTYNEALRFRDMITPEAEERVRILAFWQKHGDSATKEAFRVSRATLFRWQRALRFSGGKIDALVPGSTAPKRKRRRIIPGQVKELILRERSREKIGKEKLARLLRDDGIATFSASTIGRMLGDLKRKKELPNPLRLTLNGRTGNLIERKPRKPRKKLRSAGWEGRLAKADTIVRFTNGVKRYILTAIDLESKFAFAYGYVSHKSASAADFMAVMRSVAPVSLEAVQTDNGSEFECHFDAYLDREGIVHFWSYPKTPKMNAEIERFNRTLSEAFISKRRYLLAYDLPAFNEALVDWLLWYNSRRPHWSIGLISPLRYICNKLSAEKSQMCWTSTCFCFSD